MSFRLRSVAAAALTVAPLLFAGLPAQAATPTGPQIKHVWTIMLENEDFAVSTGEDALEGSAYLSHTLASRGALVPNYFGTGHSSGDNYVSMISGQGPTNNSQSDCGDDSVVGGNYVRSAFGFDKDGQALGDPAKIAAGNAGCVYAADVPTVVDQIKGAGLSWRGYMQGIDSAPTTLRSTCQAARWAKQVNPAPGATTKAHNDYRRKHDPFEYFHSITGLNPASGTNADTPGHTPSADCDANVVPMERLLVDLKSAATTPAFSYITPDQCNDGHDNPCTDGTTPAGVAQIDKFLPSIVDPILASPAYADGGLLVITFDEGSESFACCGEKKSPNLPAGQDNGGEIGLSTDPVPATRGGGQVGAVLLSPYIAPNTVSANCYNHYSWLHSMEDLLSLTPDRTGIAGSDGKGHLGYAGSLGDGTVPVSVGGQVIPCVSPASFGSDIFTSVPAASATRTKAPQPHPAAPKLPSAVLLSMAVVGLPVGLLAAVRRRRA